MRSGLIFAVSYRFSNRYMLCRMLATSARKMHRDGVSTSQSINNSLRALYDAEPRTGSAPYTQSASLVQDVAPKVPEEEEATTQAR
jgi:hypothetical protein